MCTKTCNRCHNTYDISLFLMKRKRKDGTYLYRGHCKLCMGIHPLSLYKYRTKKQQLIASKNCRKISDSLRTGKPIQRVCKSCNDPVSKKLVYCSKCKVVARQLVRKKQSKQREKKRKESGFYKKREEKQKLALTDYYIRRHIKMIILRKYKIKIPPSEISSDMIELTRKSIALKREISYGNCAFVAQRLQLFNP